MKGDLMSKINYVYREDGMPQTVFSEESFIELEAMLSDYPYLIDSINEEDYYIENGLCLLFNEIVSENKVVGFATYEFRDETMLLSECYILPEFRGRGLFFDELSWLDTRGSHFVTALEHFWNDWAAYRNDIKLIACGSAATWMLDKVINARGGLHNRVTHQMLISPFTLNETEKYFQAMDFPYERQEIMECYMALGGVAYYLSLFEHEKSVAQNIESLCFTRGGELTDEFKKVFKSLFKKAENHVAVMTALSKRGMGMTRQELIEAARQTNNGNLTKLLRELEECAFIRSYVPFGKAKKNMLYQLIDPFTLFHFRFMADGRNFLKGYWQKMQATAQYMNWCGYAFEVVCLNHLDQIVHALGIDGTINKPCAWSYRPSATEQDEDLCHGAQIDLLIDRSDKSISICEMKYTQDEYEITKDYFDRLQQRMRTFRKATKTKKTLIPTFVTPNGLVSNMYARRMARTVTSDGLFEVV